MLKPMQKKEKMLNYLSKKDEKRKSLKNKLEEQIDSLISQNEKEKSRIEDEIRKLEIELKTRFANWMKKTKT